MSCPFPSCNSSLLSHRLRTSLLSIPPQLVERNMSKYQRFLTVGQLFVARDPIVQDLCRQISGAGPGRSDLVARRVARQRENATTFTCDAENFFVILFNPFKKTNKKSFPNGKVQNTHNDNRLQTFDTMFSRTKETSSPPHQDAHVFFQPVFLIASSKCQTYNKHTFTE